MQSISLIEKSLLTWLRRLLLIASLLVLGWHLTEVLNHRSLNPVFAGLYSSSYLLWVSFYVIFSGVWAGLAILALLRWESLVGAQQRLFADNHWPYWLWLILPLPWASVLIWSSLVNQYISYSTPHSALVPLALVVIATLCFAFSISNVKLIENLVLTNKSWGNRLSIITQVGERFSLLYQTFSDRQADLFACLAIFVTPLPLVLPALVSQNKLMGGHDLRGLFYVVEQYISKTIHNGQLPYWNPYLYSGFPVLGRPDAVLFYPTQFLLRFLVTPNQVINWGYSIHIWVAGFGMYILCRYLKLRRWIALLCGLAFMLNGGLITRILDGNIGFTFSLAWFPTVWLFLMLALDNQRRRYYAIAAAAIVLALTILSGHPTFPGYILIFLGLYCTYRMFVDCQIEGTFRPILRISGIFGLILLLAFGLAAIQLLPSLIFASQSSLSGGYDLNGANIGALLPENISMIFLPDAYPQPTQGIWEQVPYLGIALPLAAPWAFTANKQRLLAIFLSAIALFSLAIAFGHELRIFSLLYTFLPPFRVMRVPARALVLWVPSVIVLGGLGLQNISERVASESKLAWASKLYARSTLVPLGLLAGYGLSSAINWQGHISVTVMTLLSISLSTGALVIIQWNAVDSMFFQPTIFGASIPQLALLVGFGAVGFVVLPQVIPSNASIANVVIGFSKLAALLAVISVLFPALYNSGDSAIFKMLAIGMVLVDLFTFAAKYVPISDTPQYSEAELHALQAIPEWPYGRFMAGDAGVNNSLMLIDRSNIDGYYSGLLTSYATFLRGVSTNPPADTVVLLSNVGFPKVDKRALDFLNVTNILSKKPLTEDYYRLVAAAPDYYVYQNENALPHILWVNHVEIASDAASALNLVLAPEFDYAKSVVLEQPLTNFVGDDSAPSEVSIKIVGQNDANGGLKIATVTVRPGILVLSEPYYSERSAWLDGQPTQLLKANLAFSAVVLPPGNHTVEISYVPISLYIGAAITFATIVLIIVGWIVIHTSRRFRRVPTVA